MAPEGGAGDLLRRAGDLALQVALVAGAYIGWRYARGAVDGTRQESVAHAVDLVGIERWLGTFIERDVQSWAISTGWPSDFANWMYANAHFTGSWLMLLAILLFRRESFAFVRNMLIAAFAISFLGYWLYPTAPPRFVPEFGIIDAPAAAAGTEPVSSSDHPYFNAFAAVPSMHIGLSSLLAGSLALLVRPRALKIAFLCYPLLMTYVVVATGNHWWIDGLFGLVTTALAAGVATVLARIRGERWTFHPRPAGAPWPWQRPPDADIGHDPADDER